MKAILHALKLHEFEISLLFVGSKEMATYHEQHLKRKGPTDIISFPAASHPKIPKQRKPLGDLLICMDQVKRNAKKHKRYVREELAHVLIHGVLHLMGYDHQDQGETRKMRAIEKSILHEVKKYFRGAVLS